MYRNEESKESYTPKGKNYLLAIGINKYTSLAKLKNPVKDVEELIKVLIGKYDFLPGNIVQLFDEQATRIAIMKQLRALRKKLKQHDNLIIYYAGHGFFDEEMNEGYWLTVNTVFDGEGEFLNESIGNHDLKILLKSMEARHILLISDSCFSGSFFQQERSTVAAIREERFPSRFALTSGRNEPVMDGDPNQHSPFAKSLITFLQDANRLHLPISEMISHVKEATAANSSQTPIGSPISGVGHQNGEYILRLKLNEEEVWKEVTEQHTISAYVDYLTNYPKGKYRIQAYQAEHLLTTQLQEVSYWQEISQHPSLEGFQSYLEKYPNGAHVETAKEHLQSLQLKEKKQEEMFWKNIAEEDSLEAYTLFLSRYPKGAFREEAKRRSVLKRLESYEQSYSTLFPHEFLNEDAFIKTYIDPYEGRPHVQTNEALLFLLELLIPYDPRIQQFKDDVKQGKRDPRDIIFRIIPSFPWMIGSQIRMLQIKEWREAGLRRLQQLAWTYRQSIKLLCYILMSSLWDEVVTNARVIKSPMCGSVLESFFELEEHTAQKYHYHRLLLHLIYLFKGNQISSFVPEIENLIDNHTFIEDLQYFHRLWTLLTETHSEQLASHPAIASICEKTDMHLARFLGSIAFLVSYQFMSVRDVSIAEFGRSRQLTFNINAGPVHGSDANFQSVYLDHANTRKTFFVPPRSVLLFKDWDENEYLEITPFMFDKHVYIEENTSMSDTIEVFGFSHFVDEQYVFKSTNCAFEQINDPLHAIRTDSTREDFEVKFDDALDEFDDIFGDFGDAFDDDGEKESHHYPFAELKNKFDQMKADLLGRSETGKMEA